MKRFLTWTWADTRRRVTAVLVLVWFASLTRFSDVPHVLIPLAVVGFGGMLDAVLLRLFRGRWVFPSSAGVTGWLIALILDPSSGIAPIMLAVVFAIGSKYVFRWQRHWFNPAAFGIVTSAWIFGVPVAWWAVSWSWIPAVVVIMGMLPILRRIKRLWLPLTFLLVYIAWLLVATKNIELMGRTLIDGTFILFSFVMLPEPMTSPGHRWWKYTFGTLVAILVITMSWFLRVVPLQFDPFLVSLLLADVISGLARLRVKA